MNQDVPSDSKGSRISRRNILVLDPVDGLPDIAAELAPFGWHCFKAQQARDALTLLGQYDIRVIVAVIETSSHRCQAREIADIQRKHPKLQWLAVTDGILDTSCSWLLSANFIDYYHKPLNWCRFNDSLGHAWGMSQLARDNPTVAIDGAPLTAIEGKHPLIQTLRRDLEKLGRSDDTVLLSGETGSGKGLCAKWLHFLSHRRQGPFVTLNCGALPASLIQSTLFGHEKGAFTGADKRYIGHLEQADGGTLFLDEIADLPLDLQVNLLHFLDDKQIMRIGACHPQTVNCRLIFASHQDLENAVDEGRFREDLYHRLNVLRLHVPSLREYKSDIIPMAERFLQNIPGNASSLVFSNQALNAIQNYNWPGNVRELQNRIRRAAVMAEGSEISAKALGLDRIKEHNPDAELAKQRDNLDAEVLLKAIADNRHNISAAARQLNISRTTFYRLIKKCQIQL